MTEIYKMISRFIHSSGIPGKTSVCKGHRSSVVRVDLEESLNVHSESLLWLESTASRSLETQQRLSYACSARAALLGVEDTLGAITSHQARQKFACNGRGRLSRYLVVAERLSEKGRWRSRRLVK